MHEFQLFQASYAVSFESQKNISTHRLWLLQWRSQMHVHCCPLRLQVYLIPSHLLRQIRLLRILHLLILQPHLHHLHHLINPLFTPKTHNRIRALPPQHPRRRHLHHTDPFMLTDFLQAVRNLPIHLRLSTSDRVLNESVTVLSLRSAIVPWASEHAASDG